MIVALRRCAGAGLRIDKACKPHQRRLLHSTASTRDGRLEHDKRRSISATQQHASDASLAVPDAPPAPLNILEDAAAQLGGANMSGIHSNNAASPCYSTWLML